MTTKIIIPLVFLLMIPVFLSVASASATIVTEIGNDSLSPMTLNQTWLDSGSGTINSKDFCRLTAPNNKCMFWVNWTKYNIPTNATIQNATFYLTSSLVQQQQIIEFRNVILNQASNTLNSTWRNFTDSSFVIPAKKYSPTPNNNPCNAFVSFNATCNSTIVTQTYTHSNGIIDNQKRGFDITSFFELNNRNLHGLLFYLNVFDSGSGGQMETYSVTEPDANLRPFVFVKWCVQSPCFPPPVITIQNPQNTTYLSNTIPLQFFLTSRTNATFSVQVFDDDVMFWTNNTYPNNTLVNTSLNKEVGSHNFRIEATDGSGSSSLTQFYTITVLHLIDTFNGQILSVMPLLMIIGSIFGFILSLFRKNFFGAVIMILVLLFSLFTYPIIISYLSNTIVLM